MKIKKLNKDNIMAIEGCAKLLLECFEHSWNTYEEALAEVHECLESGVVFVTLEGKKVLGFVGAQVKYTPHGWELHPLVVSPNARSLGIGSKLVQVIEQEAACQGALVMYLGTDDEDNATSLSSCDLFENTFEKIKDIENFNNHPYEFYMKNGYKIVGVLPDVNGYGKPDIYMAKRLKAGK